MDAAGSERAVIMGVSEGGPMAAMFAATHPDRTLGLVLYGAHATSRWSPDYPWGSTEAEIRNWFAEQERGTPRADDGGVGSQRARAVMPSMANDDEFVRCWLDALRMSISPGARSTSCG